MFWQLTYFGTHWYFVTGKFEATFKNSENKVHSFTKTLTANEVHKRENDIEGFIHLMLVYSIYDLEFKEGKDLTELLVTCCCPIDSPFYNVLFVWNLSPGFGFRFSDNPLRRVKFLRPSSLDPREPNAQG